MATTRYFAPTYFPPTYFAALNTPPPPAEVLYGDPQAFEAILGRLRTSRAFGAVRFGRTIDSESLAGQANSLAVLVPDRWEEIDEVDPTSVLRRVAFRIELLVRDDDPFRRYEKLERLASVAKSAIAGSNLGGGCLPALTRLNRGRYDQKSLHPEQVVRLEGEFSYLIGTAVPVGTT